MCRARDRRPSSGRVGLLAWLCLAGCRQDMHNQPKFIPLRPSGFFADWRSARPLVPGTVARGHLDEDDARYTGTHLLRRGQQRFDIFCSPCHGRAGDGQGMVVRRGFREPPSFHTDRLRAALPGHFVDVITNGYGAMMPYAEQVPVRDRWAIAAYIRALQLSQYASLSDVPPDEAGKLAGMRQEALTPAGTPELRLPVSSGQDAMTGPGDRPLLPEMPRWISPSYDEQVWRGVAPTPWSYDAPREERPEKAAQPGDDR